MSLNFINLFQGKLYQILAEDNDLMSRVRQVYLSVVQDGNYPFLLINLVKSDNYSTLVQAIYLLEFEICIFSKDTGKKTLLAIGTMVERLISPQKLAIPGYGITGVRLNELVWNDARDMAHNKLTMRYKVMIKKEPA